MAIAVALTIQCVYCIELHRQGRHHTRNTFVRRVSGTAGLEALLGGRP